MKYILNSNTDSQNNYLELDNKTGCMSGLRPGCGPLIKFLQNSRFYGVLKKKKNKLCYCSTACCMSQVLDVSNFLIR